MSGYRRRTPAPADAGEFEPVYFRPPPRRPASTASGSRSPHLDRGGDRMRAALDRTLPLGTPFRSRAIRHSRCRSSWAARIIRKMYGRGRSPASHRRMAFRLAPRVSPAAAARPRAAGVETTVKQMIRCLRPTNSGHRRPTVSAGDRADVIEHAVLTQRGDGPHALLSPQTCHYSPRA